MKVFAKELLAAVAVVGLAASSAYGVTPVKITYHCVNAKNQTVKGASSQAQCKTPYRWVKITTTAAAPHKHKGTVASAKSPKKGQMATATDPKD